MLALLPLVARDLVAGGPLIYGLLLGAFGIGAIGGAFSAPGCASGCRARRSSRLAFAGFAALRRDRRRSAPRLARPRAGLLLGGACWVLALSLFNVTVQLSTPRWVVGRALSLYQTATFGGMALGSWLWGIVAEATGRPRRCSAPRPAHARRPALVGLWLPLPDRPSSTSTR